MLATACNLAVLYGLVDYHGGLLTPLPLRLNAFYQACSRMAWGLGLAWVIFACCRGYGGKFQSIGYNPFVDLEATVCVHPLKVSIS